MFDVDQALRYLVANEGSDLHVKVPARPQCRVHGLLGPIEGSDPLTPEDTERALGQIIPERKREEFDRSGEADFSYEIEGVARFRVNAFRQQGRTSIVCRQIPHNVKTVDDLSLPEAIRTLAEEERGIVLVTGTTGSGKSTTLAAMIDHINSTMSKHVLTLEDPIEYIHRDKRSLINQREIGMDTESFAKAMRRVLRQDPDVILIGEMRDEETVRTALSAAETGHLVMSTLHTVDAAETINRIIDFFPPHHQQQARVMLAATLKGAISQRLVRTPDGRGRTAICEVLVQTGRVQDLILNPAETGRITEVIAEGGYYGMQTFDQALLKAVQAGKVSEDEAMRSASSPHDFKLMLDAEGLSPSDVSQLMGDKAEEPVVTPSRPADAPPPSNGSSGHGNGSGPGPAAPAEATPPPAPAASPPTPTGAPPVAPPGGAAPPPRPPAGPAPAGPPAAAPPPPPGDLRPPTG